MTQKTDITEGQPFALQDRIKMGLTAGLGLGMVTVIAAEAMRDTVRTIDDAERTAGLPVLAVVPEIAGGANS